MDSYLGEALVFRQINRLIGSTLGFFLLNHCAHLFSKRFVQSYSDASFNRKLWNSLLVSTFHAVVASSLCLCLVVWPDDELVEDRIYGLSDRANLVFAFSTGFFLYDLTNCVDKNGVHWGYIFHHGACVLCYTFVQFPFLAYYAIRFLLYEISTPLLNIRNKLLMVGLKSHPVTQSVEKMFGVVFFVVRILMGIPLSTLAIQDAANLYSRNGQHSTAIMLYFVIANIGLNGLNLFWLSIMIKKAWKKSGKSPPKSPSLHNSKEVTEKNP